MRIESLELAGFRGFTSSHFFDLNADSVVLIGANGQGRGPSSAPFCGAQLGAFSGYQQMSD